MTPLARPPSNPAWERRAVLTAGGVVAGAYVLRHILGEGGSGEVWAATDTTTGAPVALKVLAPGSEDDRELAERFRREAYFLARTASEHVAKIHDFVCDRELGMVLVMEEVEGESLNSMLDRTTLSVEETLAFGVQLLEGVGVLHAARVIHRDLKPGNILMRPGPDGLPRPVICDFGLSCLARRRPDESESGVSLTALTQGDVAMGTVRYMAPEQVLNARQATERSDLYSVAAILHRAVSGSSPFGSLVAPDEIARAKVIGEAPQLDCGRADPAARGLERVIARALRRRPAERYDDASAMRDALLQVAELGRLARAAEDTERASLPGEGLAAARRLSPGWRALSTASAIAVVFGAGVATGRATMPWAARDARVAPAAAEPIAATRFEAPPLTPTPELILPPEPGPRPEARAMEATPPAIRPKPPTAPPRVLAALADDNPY